ncbi:aldo/keto reductase [Streptomyces chartreusis]|uniref:aldo/keto reductase n=1 Tax=Streptomyces chartreusis TaxID=1969 RepID=UPI0036921B7A
MEMLGGTGMKITKVGLGGWAFGGEGWVARDDKAAMETIDAALGAGVNWIDTAPEYGLGHSESTIGKAIAKIGGADRPLIFTKCGVVRDSGMAGASPVRSMEPSSVRRELEGSLRRLRLDQIDLYQVHCPPSDESIEEYWQLMADLKKEGKVRAIGLANHGVEHLRHAQGVANIDCLQSPFSLIRRWAGREIAWCSRNGTGVIAFSPIQTGLLSGYFSRERFSSMLDSDWRRKDPEFTTNLDQNLALVELLRPIAERHSIDVAALAVAWVLAWPGVTGAIVGAHSARHVSGWAPAARLRLTPEDMNEVARALSLTNAGRGPKHPESVEPIA